MSLNNDGNVNVNGLNGNIVINNNSSNDNIISNSLSLMNKQLNQQNKEENEIYSEGNSSLSKVVNDVVNDNDHMFSAYHGSTKVVASTINASKAKNGNHTLYTIQIKVYFDDFLDRQWEVLRRYSDYDKLHRALKECGFPCPELPPKYLWSFHTHAFIEERRNALDLWIQGTLCIWQSVSPSQPTQAFEVGDLLESFLCDVDTDRFNHAVDHVLSGTVTELDFGTSPQTVGGSFASLARARKKNNNTMKIPPTIDEDDGRSILSASLGIIDAKMSSSSLTRRTKRYNDQQSGDINKRGHSEEGRSSLSFNHNSNINVNNYNNNNARLDRATASTTASDSANISSITNNNSLLSLNMDQFNITGELIPPMNSPNPSISTPIISRGSLFKNASTGDLESLIRTPEKYSYEAEEQNDTTVISNASRGRRSEATASNASVNDLRGTIKEKTPISKSLPSDSIINNLDIHQSKNVKRQLLPSPKGDVGVAVDLRPIDGSTPRMKNYTTFDSDGQKVTRSFKPFTATVVYRNKNDIIEQSNISGLPDASTPVSVPPTPFGQGEFFQSWAQYTNSVLDFVAQRLDRVSSKRQSILDPLENPAPIGNDLNNSHDNSGSSTDKKTENINSKSNISSSSSLLNNNNNENENGIDKAQGDKSTRSNSLVDSDDQGESLFDDQFDKIQEAVLSNKDNNNGMNKNQENSSALNGSSEKGKVILLPNRTPEEEATYRSYLSAGERLVNIILKESESAVDPLGTNWGFVANTKNVIVMQRKKPIRKGQKSSLGNNVTNSSAASVDFLSGLPDGTQSPASVMTNRSLGSNMPSNDENNKQYQSEKNESTVTSTDSGKSFETTQSKKGDSSSSSSTRQYCFMGRGVINAPASEIFEVVRRPQTRLSYDRMLKEEIILENIQTLASNTTGKLSFLKLASDAGPGDAMTDLDALGSALSESHFGITQQSNGVEKQRNEKDNNNSNQSSSVITTANDKKIGSIAESSSTVNEKVVTIDIPQEAKNDESPIGNLLVYYHLFETNRCFVRHSRDFCVLQYAKGLVSNKPNKYIVVGTSVTHPDCPNSNDVVRATIPIFGWVIESISRRQSKVSYIIQLDFGGSVSTQLLNTISFRQPLCVYYLGKYMAERSSQGRPMY